MRTYVYACSSYPNHHIIEARHKIHENPDLYCADCGERMHRVPQPLLAVYNNPQITLLDKMTDKYYKKIKRKK